MAQVRQQPFRDGLIMYIYDRCYKCKKVFVFGDSSKVHVCSLKFAERKMITSNTDDLFCRDYCMKCLEEDEKSKCCWCDKPGDRKLVKVTIEKIDKEPEIMWICEEHFEDATRHWWE